MRYCRVCTEKKTEPHVDFNMYGNTYDIFTMYYCNHPVYNKCTLYLIDDKGLAVIEQKFDPETKRTWWGEVPDTWLLMDIYYHPGFLDFFNKYAKLIDDKGLFPTVTIRQIMWGLRMKPLKKERWETVFDHKDI